MDWSSFLTGANLVWIIGIVSSIAAGLRALSKFRYQNKLQLFKDTNVNLFKKEKEEVLAAISTLSVFKRDSRFKNQTINVLLSRLYTELDYDITNAICGALVEYSNRQEVSNILLEVLDINRNFFIQTYPISQMIFDLNENWVVLNAATSRQKRSWIDLKNSVDPPGKTSGSKNDEETEESTGNSAEAPNDLERASSKELLELYRQRFLTWIPKKRYELNWHKQITADAYSIILRKAYYTASTRGGWDRLKRIYYRLVGARTKYNRLQSLDMDFYQNDFNYVYMADFNTTNCNIIRSAIASSTIVDVGFRNIGRISGSSFAGTTFYNCRLQGGVAESDTKFTSCKFLRSSFENIHLKEVDFTGTVYEGVVFDGGDLKGMSVLKIEQSSFNPNFVNSTSFTSSYFKNCVFRNCYINFSSFATGIFENVSFENVMFNETYFCNSDFKRVSFIKCKGLQPRHFYKYYRIDDETKLPSQFTKTDIDKLEKTEVEQYVLASSLTASDKAYLQSLL